MSKAKDDAAWVTSFLEDERIQNARQNMKQEIHKAWERSQTVEDREDQWRLLQLERRFWSLLERYLRDYAVERSKENG